MFYRILLLLLTCVCSAQIGINTATPKATLDIKGNADAPKGVILPSYTAEELSDLDDTFTTDQNGMMIFITEGIGSSNKTANVLGSGFYFYDAIKEIWELPGNAQPWFSSTTNKPATKNTEAIYQNAQVGIGSPELNDHVQLNVASPDKGMLIPRLSTTVRDAMISPPNGLMIYNTTSNCLNYYDSQVKKWLSLCGTYERAEFDFFNCNNPTGPSSHTFREGTPLTSLNTYTIIINVSKPGTYSIVVRTTNGYSFSKTGLFTDTGTQVIVLEGQGIPAHQGSDAVTLEFNDEIITPNCTLPTITVLPSIVTFDFQCNSATLGGNYFDYTPTTSSNYITLPVTNFLSGGLITIETNTVNGVKFSTGSIDVTAATTSITLYASGTPINPGIFTYDVIMPGSGGTRKCSIPVTVQSSTGDFRNPAKNCLEIYNAGRTTDGEYWIKTSSSNNAAVKTYCDMTNGGYTLLASYSEKTAYTLGGNNLWGAANTMHVYYNLSTNTTYNTVTAENGTMNYENFRLSLPTMQNAKSSILGDYRVHITNDKVNVNDAWAQNNYFEWKPTSGYDPIAGGASTCYESLVPTTGKLFGYEYRTDGNNVYYNNISGGDVCPYMQASGFGLHWDAGGRLRGTILAPDGITTINANIHNNLFGYFGETQANHHFGKCTSSTNAAGTGDDYSFSTASCGYGYLKPHSFNSGEGRYIQYWVK